MKETENVRGTRLLPGGLGSEAVTWSKSKAGEASEAYGVCTDSSRSRQRSSSRWKCRHHGHEVASHNLMLSIYQSVVPSHVTRSNSSM